jgi:hypothetical protein
MDVEGTAAAAATPPHDGWKIDTDLLGSHLHSLICI